MAIYKTKKDAAYAWVQEFNAIPQSVIEKLAKVDLEENGEGVTEITPPSCGDRVYIFSGDHYGENGEIQSYNEDDNTYKICLDGTGEEVDVREDDFEVERDDFLPMWGTMWQFSDSCDNWWLENHLQEMADCGFRIYTQEDYGYIFGIDGCGVQVCRSERYNSIVLLDPDDSKKKLGEFDTIGELKALLSEFGLQSSFEDILGDIEAEEDYCDF